MRCKNHATDLSSIIGVCATCLRERLFKLIVTQEQSQAQSIDQNNRNSNSNPNPTVNRSVSPHISHRKSVNNPAAIVQPSYSNKPRLNHSVSDRRVYNSPQIAITTGGCIGGSSSHMKKPNLVRFPSISNLFRSNSRNGSRNGNCNRNGDADSNHRVSVSSCNGPSGGGGRPSSVTPSPSWFSNVLPRAGAGSCQSSTTASTGVVRRQQRCVSVSDRGMSPVRTSDDGGGDEFTQFSDGSSANESAESCKLTPMKTPSVRRGGQKSVTELIFCPLVSASPHRLLKGKPPVDCGFSGDRAPVVPHIAYAKSFSGNRSRKLVDFGRADPNR